MLKLLAVALLAGMGICALGFGRGVRGLARARGGAATDLGLGLAALLFVGGVLNAAHLAFAPVLLGILATGLLVGARALRSLELPALDGPGARFELGIAAAATLSLVLFAVATQLPPAVFNFHDDLQKYFPHPVRMLATGSVAGNPFGALGAETLGGQAFLHGFILAVLPIPFVNGVDAVLGLALLALVGAAAGWRRLGGLPGAAVVPLALALVNPQYINVSSLYLGALLVATASLVAGEPEAKGPSPLQLGLVYAGLAALKTTLVVFVGVHAVLVAAGLLAEGGPRRAFGWAARVAGWSALFAAPWILVHVPVYLLPGPPGPEAVPPGVQHDPASLLSFRPLFLGATAAHYVGLALAGLAGAAVAWFRRGEAAETRGKMTGHASNLVAGAVSFVVLVPALGNAVAGFGNAIRFSIPILLGAVIVPLAAVGAPRAAAGIAGRVAGWMPLGLVAAIGLGFLPTAVERGSQAVEVGSILAFAGLPRAPEYRRFHEEAFAEAAAHRVARVQGLVPPGAPIVVLTTFPWLVDPRRNPVYTVEVGFGLGASVRVPSDARYVLWQRAGYGVRSAAQVEEQANGPGAQQRLLFVRAREILRWIDRLASSEAPLHDDGELVLLRIPS